MKIFSLKNADIQDLEMFLNRKGFFQVAEKIVKKEKPGEGNMNFVVRVITNQRSFILKQANEYVEKYPHIPAPKERIQIEAQFYKKIASNGMLKQSMPELLYEDLEDDFFILEDLGNTIDYSYLYNREEKLSGSTVIELTNYLNDLHISFAKTDSNAEIENKKMRALNQEHIFYFPFLEKNGFNLNDIQDGLQELSLKYKRDNKLKDKLKTLAAVYLENGRYLLHGDFYPGSWLKTATGIKIIDPEFCFFGPREFDLSVFIAHLTLSNQSEELIKKVQEKYLNFNSLDGELLDALIGVEIIRRLLGLAQIPLRMSLNEKEKMLEKAYHLIIKNDR